jgi:hypothetical protein
MPGLGEGLFARRAFKKGEIIYVAPSLVFSKKEVEEEGGELMNFCIVDFSNRNDVAVLPLGMSSLMNHRPEPLANVELEWHDWGDYFDAVYGVFPGLIRSYWPSAQKGQVLRSNLSTVLSSMSAPLDIAYRARRDIKIYEELTISYGREWETAYEAYKAKRVELGQQGDELALSHLTFRHFIGSPKGLFPSSWNYFQ